VTEHTPRHTPEGSRASADRPLSRRRAIAGGTGVGLVAVALPAAAAAASVGDQAAPIAPSTPTDVTFSEVSETGFTVTWS